MVAELLQVGSQKNSLFPISSNDAFKPRKCFLGNRTTGELAFEIKLVGGELKELQQVLREYGFSPLPRWIGRTVKLTQRRRKWLMAVLHESGCGNDSCQRYPSGGWDDKLHQIYHKLMN